MYIYICVCVCVCVCVDVFFHHVTCESVCDTLPSSVVEQDNTVSVAQDGTVTPGVTEQYRLELPKL